MKTRTLLLLAVGCGLAILLAGGVQLLRLSNQHADPPLALGDTATAGDARVMVQSFEESDGMAVVTVTLSGVDDPRGVDGLTLVTPSAPLAVADGSSGGDACTGFTVAAVTCTLTFDTSNVTGKSRQLLFQRAEQKARWKLV